MIHFSGVTLRVLLIIKKPEIEIDIGTRVLTSEARDSGSDSDICQICRRSSTTVLSGSSLQVMFVSFYPQLIAWTNNT